MHDLEAADEMQSVIGSQHDVNHRFRDPQLSRDFHLQRNGAQQVLQAMAVCLLIFPKVYVALLPDDPLAMQELVLAWQGMATTAQCPFCSAMDVQPFVI